MVSGAEGWESIEEFGHEKIDWLRQFIKLENGIPPHDCIARVLSRIPSEEFTQCFVAWVESVSTTIDGEVVAIDGKTARYSYDRSKSMGAIHVVSAWATDTGMSLGQVKTAEKSNEITAIPTLLEILELKGCIVTIDAMGYQKDIAQKVTEKGADYVLAVGNQKHLQEAIEEYFSTFLATGSGTELFTKFVQSIEETDAGHGRVEVRRFYLSECLDTIPKVENWQGLKAIGMVESERHIGDKIQIDRRYYVASLTDIRKFSGAVRKHWGVENSHHWVLDVVFREDDSRICKGEAPANFNIFRQIALNLLKKVDDNKSIKKRIFRCALSDRYRKKVIFAGKN